MGDHSEIALKSLAELSQKIRSKDISPVELTTAYIERIEALDGLVHSFNAVLADTAMQEAKQAETAIQRGEWLGPLHGIPIGIKDMINVVGVPTTAQAAHRIDHIANRDSAVVQAIRQSGAVILGKQAMTEYAVGGTQFNLPWPPARNPWNTDLDPLSSSSGPAISVAMGFCAGAVGTETAGSIRGPAA